MSNRLNMGIASQFWDLKEPEYPEFKLNIEFVDKFPEKILKHAEKLIAWAFKAGPKTPTLTGFPIEHSSGRIDTMIFKAYAIVNEYGVFKQVLVHNTSRAYLLELRLAASSLSWLLRILKSDGKMFFDSDEFSKYIQDIYYSNKKRKKGNARKNRLQSRRKKDQTRN